MSTAILVLGGIGLFLLGMTIMTDGLKGLAGSSLRTVLGKAAATPLSGDEKAGAALSLAEPVAALREARDFLSVVSGPPDSEREERRLTSTLHALDHVSRLAEIAGEAPEFPTTREGPDEARAATLCAQAMRAAALAVADIAGEKALSAAAAPIGRLETPEVGSALALLERSAQTLDALRRAHRGPTLSKVATGEITADQAMARIETLRRLEALARHAWRGTAHLLGHIESPAP